jgi:hypothetical protein
MPPHYDDAEASDDEREGMINGTRKKHAGARSVVVPLWLSVIIALALVATALLLLLSPSSASGGGDSSADQLAEQLTALQASVDALQSRVATPPPPRAGAPSWNPSFPPRSVIESCDRGSPCPGVVAWLQSHTPPMKPADPTATAREKYLA